MSIASSLEKAQRRILKFAVAAALVSSLNVSADDLAGALDRTISVNIPPQKVSTALLQLSEQAGVQVLMPGELVDRHSTRGVKGSMSIEQALRTLLDGTTLQFKAAGENAIGIEAVRDTAASYSGAAVFRTASALADASGSRSAQAQSSEANLIDDAGSESDVARALNIPEVLVQGSRMLNMDIKRSRDDVQPYVVFDRETIVNSGAISVEDFLKQRLPMNGAGSSNNQSATNSFGNASTINLRGLGAAQTLILIDGRRASSLVSFGEPSQPDLNGIPLAAIERIEVLPTTASGIYGGSATGGVVNVVLRRDYSGGQVQMSYENVLDGHAPTRRVDMSLGLPLESGKTSVLLVGSYTEQDALLVKDRPFLRDARARILANNPDYLYSNPTPPLGATPNIRSIDGSDLVLRGSNTSLNSPVTHVPAGYSGLASDGGAAFLRNAGSYNLGMAQSTQADGGLMPLTSAPTIESLGLTVRRRFTSSVEAYVDGFVSNNESLATTSEIYQTFDVPENSPVNPFTTPVRVAVPLGAGDAQSRVTVQSRRASAGVIARLPVSWSMQADYTWSNSTLNHAFGALHRYEDAHAAIASGGLDIFRDPTLIDYSPFIDAQGRTYFDPPQSSVLHNGTMRLGGPIATIPGGAVDLSATLEYRKELYEQSFRVDPNFGLISPSRDQSVSSAYLETKIPLFSSRNARRGLQELELQIAARWDRYTVNGSTGFVMIAPQFGLTRENQPIERFRNQLDSVNPTLGVRYKPIDDLAFRASYGTGFLPPSVGQLASSLTPSGVVLDPRRGGTQTAGIDLLSGGNPDLEPEESRSWSVGFVYTPSSISGARLSVDYTRIEKTDVVTNLGVQQIVDNESLFASRITRGPNLPGDPVGWAGPITRIDATLANLNRSNVTAFDVALDYVTESPVGTLEFFVVGTWQPDYETQLLALSPIENQIGLSYANPVEIKANGGVKLRRGNWNGGWLTRYLSSYQVADPAWGETIFINQGARQIPRQIYHDVYASYTFSSASDASAAAGLLNGTEVRFGVKNVFDKEPPLDLLSAVYYSQLGDPRLAAYYLTVTKSFGR